MQIGIDQTIVVPVQIRQDLIIRIHIPANLTKDEAEKVANVVKASTAQMEKLK